jgi:hypothetical protein
MCLSLLKKTACVFKGLSDRRLSTQHCGHTNFRRLKLKAVHGYQVQMSLPVSYRPLHVPCLLAIVSRYPDAAHQAHDTGHRMSCLLAPLATVIGCIVLGEFFFIFSPNLKQILNLTRLSKKF